MAYEHLCMRIKPVEFLLADYATQLIMHRQRDIEINMVRTKWIQQLTCMHYLWCEAYAESNEYVPVVTMPMRIILFIHHVYTTGNIVKDVTLGKVYAFGSETIKLKGMDDRYDFYEKPYWDYPLRDAICAGRHIRSTFVKAYPDLVWELADSYDWEFMSKQSEYGCLFYVSKSILSDGICVLQSEDRRHIGNCSRYTCVFDKV